ncbi:MAG: hypothetical protein ACLUIQ_02095 [Dialister invisus]
MTTEDTDGMRKFSFWERTDRPYSQLLMVKYTVILKNNPFHAEGGGQIGIAVYWKEMALFP